MPFQGHPRLSRFALLEFCFALLEFCFALLEFCFALTGRSNTSRGAVAAAASVG
jgi:hypothetical protein